MWDRLKKWWAGPETVWYWNEYHYGWCRVDSNPMELTLVVYLFGENYWIAVAWRKGPLKDLIQSYTRCWDTGLFAGYRIWRPETFFNLPWFHELCPM